MFFKGAKYDGFTIFDHLLPACKCSIQLQFVIKKQNICITSFS